METNRGRVSPNRPSARSGSGIPGPTEPAIHVDHAGADLLRRPLGRASVRRLGAWTLYFTSDAPLRVALVNGSGGSEPWRDGDLAIVPPHTRHRVESAGRRLPDVLLEPESIDID